MARLVLRSSTGGSPFLEAFFATIALLETTIFAFAKQGIGNPPAIALLNRRGAMV